MLRIKSTPWMRILLAAIALLALVAACAPVPPGAATPTTDPDAPVSSDDPTPAPSETPDPDEFIFGEDAIIEELDILILESFPVQVNVMVRGFMPDGCTVVDRGESERTDDTFRVRIFTRRPAEAVCTDALVAFEHTVPLDVLGLPAGEYTVQAGPVSETFTLAVDNMLPTEGTGGM